MEQDKPLDLDEAEKWFRRPESAIDCNKDWMGRRLIAELRRLRAQPCPHIVSGDESDTAAIAALQADLARSKEYADLLNRNFKAFFDLAMGVGKRLKEGEDGHSYGYWKLEQKMDADNASHQAQAEAVRELVEALRPFADFSMAFSEFSGTMPKTGEFCVLRTKRGTRTITIEDFKNAHTALSHFAAQGGKAAG